MSANAIERLRGGLEWMAHYNLTGSERTLHIDFQGKAGELLPDVAAVEALLEAAKRVDDLSEGPIHDFDALWSACEELHRVIRRVETGQ